MYLPEYVHNVLNEVARTHLTALTHLPSVFFPLGSQVYHSALCIIIQFLLLRLMGRTVTGVLSSFIFQMVRGVYYTTMVSSFGNNDTIYHVFL